MKECSNSLRQHRERAGLTQSEAAAALGFVGNDRISHWERGRAVPSLRNLFNLAALYRALPHELYGELWEQSKREKLPKGSFD